LDYKRNFSAYKATEEVIAARRMFLANGSQPLSGPALLEANTKLENAALNIREVMLHGVLAFSRCFTCNPNAVLGTKAPNSWPDGVKWTLQEIANQVAVVEANVTGGATPIKHGSIADSLKNNWILGLQRDYCGAYANTLDVSHIIGKWEYGRVDVSPPISTDFNLTKQAAPRGLRITGYNDPKERTWWLIGNEIILVHQDGALTARLSRGNDDYWEGPYYLEPGKRIAHYIQRTKKEEDKDEDEGGEDGTDGGGGEGGGGCPVGQCDDGMGIFSMPNCRPSAPSCNGGFCSSPGCP